MTSPQRVDRETFLRRLQRSGLLSADEFANLSDRLPTTSRGRVVARALVEQGVLTRFQAEQLLAGRTRGFVVGPYRILEQLGFGGMGCVFKAEHRDEGRIVALKAIAPRLLRSRRALQFFAREVRALSRLRHPHIVKALHADRDGDRHYLVMEYVDGPNLDQLVRRHGPLPVGQACEFVRQAAEALEYASRKGMVHRDIKPANLLLALAPIAAAVGRGAGADDVRHADVKVTDFGLARLGAPGGQAHPDGTVLTRPNTVMGTPDYIAPEQARSLHDADIRSDLYSLGCTFYYLLSGQVPFPGGSTLEKLVRHSVEEPQRLEELRPEVPRQVGYIIRRLMAKTPDDRIQTPGALAEALKPFCADDPVAYAAARSKADVLPTPSGEDGLWDRSDSGGDLGDAESALVGTMMTDPSATPVGPTAMGRGAGTKPRGRWFFPLMLAASAGGGVLLAWAVKMLLAR